MDASRWIWELLRNVSVSDGEGCGRFHEVSFSFSPSLRAACSLRDRIMRALHIQSPLFEVLNDGWISCLWSEGCCLCSFFVRGRNSSLSAKGKSAWRSSYKKAVKSRVWRRRNRVTASCCPGLAPSSVPHSNLIRGSLCTLQILPPSHDPLMTFCWKYTNKLRRSTSWATLIISIRCREFLRNLKHLHQTRPHLLRPGLRSRRIFGL